MKYPAVLLILVCLTFPVASSGDDLPPGVEDTQDPIDVSLTPLESLSRMQVPDGFQVTLFAGEPDVRRPIAFDFDDRGRVWVVENYSHPDWRAGEGADRIVILEDVDNDGRFDKRTVFWDKGRYLTGIAVGHGGVWIANTPELSFIPDANGDDVPDSGPIVKLDGFRISNNNVVNNFHWGPDGWLYGAIGLPVASSVGPPGTPDSQRVKLIRGIWRYHPYTEEFQQVARGMVNPWGADFNEYGDLFTSNTVIAHLWHIVPGMYCQRRGHERDNPYAYGRIQSITDHLHWGGGKWTSSRRSVGKHDVAGGGHAHCGGMIYLGDNWPAEYRGTFFTGNLHGNRINNDQLVPSGSSYVGVHRPDFLFAHDPWFRSMSQKYGPDGGVFISDWHDFGECHDTDGSHRSSGRIFKVVYGKPERGPDLSRASNSELAQLHTHRNEWVVRHARRILHQRAAGQADLSQAAAILEEGLSNESETIYRLRCLWSLYVMDCLSEQQLIGLLADNDPHIRRWAVRLLVDHGQPSSSAMDAIADCAGDALAVVRLAVASAMPRLSDTARWHAASQLASNEGDNDDHYLPLMIWYGIEPLVPQDVQRALELATRAKMPIVQQFIARRLMEMTPARSEEVVSLLATQTAAATREALLMGMVDALRDARGQEAPDQWPRIRASLLNSKSESIRSLALEVSLAFGDELAIEATRGLLLDPVRPLQQRRAAFASLVRIENGLSLEQLHELLQSSPDLRGDVIPSLTTRAQPVTGSILLGMFDELSERQQHDALRVLVSTADTASLLLSAIESGRIAHDKVSAYEVQILKVYTQAELKSRVDAIWPADSDQSQKSEQIAHYKRLLTPEYIAEGNVSRGRVLFETTCGKCHQLFGEGATLAPDLTGSGRANLDYVLSNLVDPSGLVEAEYRLTTVITAAGRIVTGFMIEHTEDSVLLRTQEGRIRLPFSEVESLQTSGKSMMPEGLLETYSLEQVRDLVRYLASPQQVPLPSTGP